MRTKKAQSEFVGFAIIIIIIMVLVLVFLAISLSSPKEDTIESYESELFMQSMLDYTTVCSSTISSGYLNIGKLIKRCSSKRSCSGQTKTSCKILNETLEDLLSNAWEVGENLPVKGYNLKITSKEELLTNISAGSITSQKKGSSQIFDGEIKVNFIVYY